MKTFYLFALLLAISFPGTSKDNLTIYYDTGSGQADFAVGEIIKALAAKETNYSKKGLPDLARLENGKQKIVLVSLQNNPAPGMIEARDMEDASSLKPEGFIIHRRGKRGNTILVVGKDEAGVMYGGLEVAEVILTSGIDKITNQLQNPYMKVRGTKFNIPLDARTPSYSDVSDAAQNNIPEMWSFAFWKDYIDNLARYRYNTISLWSLHPFPSMVKVPEYPDVALDDVHRSTVEWEENYELSGMGFDSPEIINNYEVIKKITIEEKMDFWRDVMAYGKERNVQFYVLTWNIFVNGTFGKYGITDKLENPVTTDYFRKSIRQMVLEYPDLAGIGLTTGENMYDYTPEQKEEWAFDTYGRGVLDAIEAQPGRKINLIHRQHQTEAKEITKIFSEVMSNPDINFIFSFKYAKAHVYSSVNQVYHHNFVKDITSAGNLKTLWTLRNDDIYQFRWGAPTFVREFLKNIPYDVSEGYYYGSDQWVWGREFLGKYSSEPREIEIVKHWYQWMCWGRLGYNPEMTNARFKEIIQVRFPSVDAQEMFDAWQSASMVYPLVTGFHWGSLDFQWYIESGQSQPWPANTPTGYHDVNRFITLAPHKGTDYISIPDYTRAYAKNTEIAGISPIELAGMIIDHADKALAWANKQVIAGNSDLQITVDDIRTISWMGKYYAHKILGATYLSLFRETGNTDWNKKTIEELNKSAGYWRSFASSALANYHNPLWTNRVGYVDWKENFTWVLYDITMNGGTFDLPSMDASPFGDILEAEDASFFNTMVKNDIEGYTGNGYLRTRAGDGKHQVEWTYQASEAGQYILEFRYTSMRERIFTSPVEINGSVAGQMEFWMTGNAGAWVWDRITVELEEGENKIAISPEGFILLDHLNIIKN